MIGESESNPSAERFSFPGEIPTALAHNGHYVNCPGEINSGRLSGPNRSYVSNTQNVDVNVAHFAQQCSLQSSPSHILEYFDEWASLPENYLSEEQAQISLSNRSTSQLDLANSGIFNNCDLPSHDSNSNNNNNHQLPSFSSFSQTIQLNRDIASPTSLSSSLPQSNQLPPTSPFSSTPSPFSSGSSIANNCELQSTNAWLPSESSVDSQSTGQPSPYNSPQKSQLRPDYFNNTHVPTPSNVLQLRIK